MGERLRGTASGWSSSGVEKHQFDSWPLRDSTGKARNCKPEQCLENKWSPTALASHGHLHTCKFHEGRGFLELGRQVKWLAWAPEPPWESRLASACSRALAYQMWLNGGTLAAALGRGCTVLWERDSLHRAACGRSRSSLLGVRAPSLPLPLSSL